MDQSDDLTRLIDALQAGDASRLPELALALQAHAPEAVISALAARNLEITGDGNIVGSGNVAIVVKGEFPALAARLADMAEQTRRAERGERAANLFGQAAVLLERGQVSDALEALVELRALDAHYPGSAELLHRACRLRTWRRLGIAALIVMGLAAAIGVTWSLWQENMPLECQGEIPMSEEGVLASAAQSDVDGTRWWVGMSGGGLETFTARSAHVSYDFRDLVADTVAALAVDERNGRIWVGTSGGGLAVLGQESERADWRPYSPVASYTRAGRDGLPGCRVSTIYLDGERGCVGAWDGHSLGVLEADEQWRHIAAPSGWEKGVYFIPFSIAKGFDGALWVGTNYGLYRLSGDDWSCPYQPPWDTAAPGAVRAVVIDEDGVIWIGVMGDGLALHDERLVNAPWIGPITTNDGLASNDVQAIALFPTGGGALVGTKAGLSICRWKGETEKRLECEVHRKPDVMGVPIHSLSRSKIAPKRVS